jgi:DMSO reductase family type II enzyme chaperone
MTEQAHFCSQLYAVLAVAFRKPQAALETDGAASLAQVIGELAAALDGPALQSPAEALAAALEVSEAQAAQALHDLEAEYNRLFFGPARPETPPYESVWRDPQGRVMGPAAHAVQQQYAEAGLALAPDYHDLPDHLATELGFMAYLAAQQVDSEGDDQLAWVERQRVFLQQHLVVWLPPFCQRVRQVSRHPFYAALAELTMTFVSLDAQRIKAVPCK